VILSNVSTEPQVTLQMTGQPLILLFQLPDVLQQGFSFRTVELIMKVLEKAL
jgi:hypothetical protein